MGLEPDELKKAPDNIVNNYEELETFVILLMSATITKILKQESNSKSARQMIAEDILKITKQAGSITMKACKELEKLYEILADKSIDNEDKIYEKAHLNPTPLVLSSKLQQFLKAAIKQTNGELTNYSKSLGFSKNVGGKIIFMPIATFYQGLVNEAIRKTMQGDTDYIQAIQDTVKQLSDSGLETVSYASGWKNKIDVAVRRAVLTGINQMTGQMSIIRADEMGITTMEITAHSGSRPSHAIWQGRIVDRSGEDKRFLTLTDIGYGTVTGFKGANCRHDWNPFIDGVSTRTYTDKQLEEIIKKDNETFEYSGKQYTTYKATQKQRQIEASIRKTKRELLGLQSAIENLADTDKKILEDKFKQLSNKLAEQRKEYKNFSEKAGLLLQNERHQVYKFNKSISMKAIHANKKYVENKNKSDIINLKDKNLVKIKQLYDSWDKKDIKAFAEKLTNALDIKAPVIISDVNSYGSCPLAVDTNKKLVCLSYKLYSKDLRSIEYKIKTCFHEAFHAKADGLSYDFNIDNQENLFNFNKWLIVEESFAEITSHYILKSIGIDKEISVAYSDYLIEVLPKLKKLKDFENCNTIADFGEITYKFRFGEKPIARWKTIYNFLSKQEFNAYEYDKQYIKYISDNKENLMDIFLDNTPEYRNTKENLLEVLDSVMDSFSTNDCTGIFEDDIDRITFNNILLIAMNRLGVK